MAEIRLQGQVTPVRIVNQMTTVRNESPILGPAGDEKTFLTLYDYISGSLIVSLNGMRMREGEDYDFVESGDRKFRFNFPVLVEDSVICDYIIIL